MSEKRGSKIGEDQRYKLYSITISKLFEKIDYYLSKKNIFYQEIKDYIKIYKSELEKDKASNTLNSDKYFPIMAKSLELENYKITECFLETMRILIENNFLWGKSPDVPILIPSTIEKESKDRKLIDTIVESLTRLDSIKDEEIWNNLIDVLNEIIINENINVHNDSFEKVYKCYIRVFQNSKNQLKIESYRSKIELLITLTFDKMSQLNQNSSSLNNNNYNFFSKANTITSNRNLNINNNNNFSLLQMIDTPNPDNIMNYSPIYQTYNNLNIIFQKNCISNNYNNNNNLNNNMNLFSGLDCNLTDVMICRIVKNMINTICLNDKKNEALNSNIIPINENDFLQKNFRKLNHLDMSNEYGIKAGYFGWCFVCGKTANYYCKESKKPICSLKCKEILEKEDIVLEKIRTGLIIPKDILSKLLFDDCLILFKYLSSLLSKDPNLKIKLLSLDMITIIIERYGELIDSKKEFINVIQENLTEGLFQNCLCENIDIYKKSVHLFFSIWKTCRENLKLQIGIFNETVFLKILDSENYSYTQKKIVLEYFSKQESIYFIELYVNYDCDLNEKFLVRSIIEALNKIAQGKYIRTAQSFTEEENYDLRNLALSSVYTLIDSIYQFCNEFYGKSKNNFINDNPIINNNNNNNNKAISNNFISPLTEENNFDDLTQLTESESPDALIKDKIDSNLKMKNELQNAVDKFNIKIKNGINYLKRLGYVKDTSKQQEAMDITKFIRNTPGLKKTFIGDLLGENNELELLILKYYSESFNYKNMHIIQALRAFLGTFQLPGEGQKIDRILQNFAAKYHKDNPTLFHSADTAYYLTFSIMILQTELHNPNVKNKMDFETFSKMLDGQNGGQNLDQKYLKDIYDQIRNNPFSLPELDEQNDKLLDKKEVKLKREKQRILRECSQQMKQNKDKIYVKIMDKEEFVTPFMENIWSPIFAMYSVILEESNDKNFYYKCISGMSNCIKILGLLNLDYPKTSFINSFASMTNLLHIKPMTTKSILCIKELLFLANSDCRYIKSSWNKMLELINKIYYYHLYVTGSKSEKETIINSIHKKIKINPSFEAQFDTEKENMNIIAKEITSNDYEKIFVKSVKFDQDSIVDFIDALCSMGKKLYKDMSITRVFWLQKIVEVSELNLNRIRFNWSKMWKIISGFLIEVGISPNSDDSITAVDSLRQLAMKYLQKTESKEYHFQSEFFKPFQDIWEKTQDLQIKDYIISCINNLVLSEAESIKSGWMIILNIYSSMTELKGMTKDILNKVVSTLIEISQKHYEDIKEIFKEFANCIKIYSKIFPDNIITILDSFIYKVANKDDFQILLSCYFHLISNDLENIRQISLTKFFICLHHGLTNKNSTSLIISNDFWSFLFNEIIIPLIKILNSHNYSGTLEELLIKSSTLFNDYFNANHNLLSNFFDSITLVISSENENVADTGLICIKYVFGCERIHNLKFLHLFIMLIINSINKIVPSKIINIQITDIDNPNNFESSNRIISKFIVECMCLHCLLEIIEQIIEQYFTVISEEDIILILKCLENIFIFSYNFNTKVELRIKISETHIHDSEKMLGIYKQMKNAIRLYFNLLTKLYLNLSQENNKESFFNQLMETSIKIFRWVIDKINELADASEKSIYNPIIEEKENLLAHISETLLESVFPSIMKIKFYTNENYKNKITKILLDLILCNLIEIRQKVKEILDFILFPTGDPETDIDIDE